jgi:hypothetical protein|tara:strand:- start:1241 stop:1660 length:420 start_codon:yes stop_codon:yes gene_type:complete
MATYIDTSNDISYNQATQNTITTSVSIPAGDAGIDQNIATDALVISLPQIHSENIGLTYLFRNTGADGNNIITLSPHSTDGFNGSIANAAADSVASGVVDKDWVNTKATANKGDYVIIRAVALTQWYIVGGVGIWASEA